jgi:hypothetical protein
MYQRYKERFGTAGVVIGVIALILALGGTAFAAAKLNSTQKKEVEKIAKKNAGKPGAPGATGPAGTPGTNGTNGKDGTNGTPGAPGESVTATTITGPAGCEKGGSEFKVGATTTYACNGKNGTTGFTETLPSEKTETGTWGYTFNEAGNEIQIVPISFPIPLETPLEGTGCKTNPPAATCHVHYIKVNGMEDVGSGEEVTPTQCGAAVGGSAAEPQAAPGNLCVYASELGGYEAFQVRAAERINNPSAGFGEEGAAVSGAVMIFEEQVGVGYGTWAVTAE